MFVLLPTQSVALLAARSTNMGSVDDLRDFLLELSSLTYTCKNATRVGRNNDGGYVVCEDAPLTAKDGCLLLGYGISSNDDFEVGVSNRWGCAVQEFDPTVRGSPGAKAHPQNIHFHKEGISGGPGVLSIGRVDSLEHHLQRFGSEPHGRPRLLVKMDVEGSEWQVLNKTSDEVLGRVDHLIMELHMYGPDGPYGTLAGGASLLRRLKRLFYLYNVHFNNCHVCRKPLPGGDGYFVPGAVELSMVRKTRVADVPKGPFRGHPELESANTKWEAPLSFKSFPIPPS